MKYFSKYSYFTYYNLIYFFSPFLPHKHSVTFVIVILIALRSGLIPYFLLILLFSECGILIVSFHFFYGCILLFSYTRCFILIYLFTLNPYAAGG